MGGGFPIGRPPPFLSADLQRDNFAARTGRVASGSSGDFAVQTGGSSRVLTRMLRLSWEYRWSCIAVLSLQAVLLALGLGGLWAAGLGIDYVAYKLDAANPPPVWPIGISIPEHWQPWRVLGMVAGGIVGLALIRAVLNYSYHVAQAFLVQRRIVVRLRAAVYEKMQRLSFRFFDLHASGTLINRVTTDVQGVRLFVDGVLIQTFLMALTLGVYCVYMMSIHAGLTAACLAPTPVLLALSLSFSRRVRPLYVESRRLVDEMIRMLSESMQGISVVKSFAREPEFRDRFGAASDAVRSQGGVIAARIAFYTPLIGFVSQLPLAILLVYGGWLAIRGDIALGSGLVVFAGVLQQFSGQVSNVAGIANSAQQSLNAARRVFEVLDADEDVREADDCVHPERIAGAVEFREVSFAYEHPEPVLRDITFKVAAGERIGVFGETGAGKSTLLSLIPRFFDATSGEVLVDGVPARQLALRELRQACGLVFQEAFLFSTTVAANIAFGHPTATFKQIERAACVASADGFVRALPHGFETVINEEGANLSGGQRQRLALARAVLLDPPILLLDDPTAAVDPETEAEIFDALERAMRGRTTFLVTNRVSALRRMDRILVLNRGRLIGDGVPAELGRRPGPYRNAVELQSAV